MAFKYTVRADGRLMKRVSVNGKLKDLYSDDPKDLEMQYIENKYLSKKGLAIESNGISVEQWTKKWLNTYKSDKEKATNNMYSHAIDKYIIPNIGHIKLKNLKENDISNMLSTLNNTPREKEVVLLTIKQILEKAVDNDLIQKNVANKIKIKKYKAPEKKPLTDLEISYLKRVSETDDRCFAVYFVLMNGLRREELAPLLLGDIDIENKITTIDKAVHWEKNKPFVKATKNEDIRKLPLVDVLFDRVKEIKSKHKDTDLFIPAVRNNGIMSETSIKRLLDHTLYEINKLYRKDQLDMQKDVSEEDVEIKTIKFTYHQLRHTYACMLHKAGIPVKEAQYLTGHKSLSVLLNIYTHLDEEDKKNAAEKLNNLLKV